MTLVLSFFNGRTSPDEELNDWGLNGPRIQIGTLAQTYGFTRILNTDDEDIDLEDFEEDNLFLIDGIYYGDYQVSVDNDFKPDLAQDIVLGGVTFRGYPADVMIPETPAEHELQPEREFVEMTEEEWRTKFKPLYAMKSLSFVEWAEAQRMLKQNKIWSLIEGDGGLYIVSGVSVVNRLEFILTAKAYDSSKDYQVVYHLESEIDD